MDIETTKNSYQTIAQNFDDQLGDLVGKNHHHHDDSLRTENKQQNNKDFVSYSYPIITSSIIHHNVDHNDDNQLIRSIENRLQSTPTLLVTHDREERVGEESTIQKPKSLATRIPYFGMICSMLSVFCYSLASLIVKLLTDLHA